MSLLTLSDRSDIPHEQMNLSNFDVTAWYSVQTLFEYRHRQCHHYVNNDRSRNEMNNYLSIPEQSRKKRTTNDFFPFISFYSLTFRNKLMQNCLIMMQQ